MAKAVVIARMLWLFYSLLCVLFVGVLIADLLLVWAIGAPNGVTLYVNRFGEGFQEQLQLLSLVPWITVTFIRTLEDAAQPNRKNMKLTVQEWAAFKKWITGVREPRSAESKKRN